MPTVDARPGRLDVVLRPSNAYGVNMTFPSVLTGRTFTADTDGTALSVSVAGAVVTVTFSALVTAALTGRPTWRLVETTTGTQTLITGRVLPSLSGTESQDLDVNVSVDTVAVTVVAGPASGGVAALTVVTETAFGQASAVGVTGVYARGDHTHGSPTDPVPAHVAAADPHPSYLTAAEGTVAYEPSGSTASHAVDTTAVHGIADTAALIDTGDIGVSVQAHSPVLAATTASFLIADETRLDGIAAGATVNSTDAALRDRATHTGAQGIPTVTGLQAGLDSKAATTDARLSDTRTPTDGTVTTAKIGDGQVTAAKVAADVATQAELDAEATTRAAADTARLLLAGGTLTGPLVLAADGSAALHPVSKQQLDTATSTAVTLAGAQTITGLKTVSPSAAAAVGLIVKGVASQTADLQQWQNSAGTVLVNVTADGGVRLGANGNASARPAFEGAGGQRIYSRADGGWGVGDASGSAPLVILPGEGGIVAKKADFAANSANQVVLRVAAGTGQTADLQQWQNSAGAVLAKVSASGDVESGVAGKGFIAKSPNGTRYRIVVSDLGAITATAA